MTKVREATHTVAFVDEYCAQYRALFANVRHFEQFTALHLGLLAETKRKSLTRLAKTAKADAQALHHFLANAEWSVEDLRAKRVELLLAALAERPFILCIDETGDRKKGKTTDYVAHQYIGNIGGLGRLPGHRLPCDRALVGVGHESGHPRRSRESCLHGT